MSTDETPLETPNPIGGFLFLREKLDEERARLLAMREREIDLRFLIGFYTAKATGNTDLAALIREMTEVLDGTWQPPDGAR
jgi:hypothetical protein